MRLKLNTSIAVSFIAITSITMSCVESDKDLYDPNYKLDNPLQLVAPPSFDATTIKTASISIEANDEFVGEYYYLVEVFDKNPLFDESANALTKGVAKKGEPYSNPITYLKGLEGVYVQQTDPRGRKEVMYVPITSSSDVLHCNFATSITTAPQSRAGAGTRADNTIKVPTYDNIPARAIEIDKSELLILDNGEYKITGNYNGVFKHNGVSNAKLYISGTWTFDTFQVERGLEIIVLSGGKITADKLKLVGTSGITIMKGGEATIANNLELTNNNEVYNLGKLTAGRTSNNPGLFYNGVDAEMTVGDFSLGGAKNYNYGIIHAKTMKTSWGSTLTNNCQINVAEKFQFEGGTLTQEKGAIIAETMEFNKTKIELNNGSMLKAKTSMNLQSNCTTNGGKTGNGSLVKSPTITFTWNITYSGNLVIESNSHPTVGGSYKLTDDVKMTTYNGSNLTIITCAGEVNTPETAGNPESPGSIEINDKYIYTYAFEDQWPLYGDYDMNDVVLRISNVKTKKDKKHITKLSYDCEVMAVGAFSNLSMGLQLDEINPSHIDGVKYSNSSLLNLDFFKIKANGVENEQKMTVIPLFSSAHKVIDKNATTATYINTVKTEPHKPTQKFNVEINFKSASIQSITMSDFNIFIITDNKTQQRKEIHLPGYKPSDLATAFYFGKNNDRSLTNKYYASEDNLGWGILVAEPQSDSLWRWPAERKIIKNAYAEFAEWVISGGVNNPNWYKTWNKDLVY